MWDQVPAFSMLLMPFVGLFGFMLRRIFVKLDQIKSEDEIRRIMEDRLAPLHVRQKDLYADISRIENKLDKILDLILNGKRR